MINLLHCRGMDDHVGTLGRPCKSLTIANVADEPTKVVVTTEACAELALFQLVTAEDDDLLELQPRQPRKRRQQTGFRAADAR